jgi:hypothetical protein
MRIAPVILTLLTAAAVLSGCGKLVLAPQPHPTPDPVAQAPAAPLNIHDPAPGADALWIPDTGGALLGEGVASLGDVTRPGAWVRAGFLPEDGAEVEIEADTPHGTVRIRVSGVIGEGPLQLSLAAYQALGLSPTALPTLRVFSAEESPDAG